MIRTFTGTSLQSIQPSSGYKWILLSALLVLTTGTGSGTRALSLGITLNNAPGGYAVPITSTGDQTGTSTTYRTYLIGSGGSQNTSGQLTALIEIDADTQLTIYGGLITGDTVVYSIQVDEVLDA